MRSGLKTTLKFQESSDAWFSINKFKPKGSVSVLTGRMLSRTMADGGKRRLNEKILPTLQSPWAASPGPSRLGVMVQADIAGRAACPRGQHHGASPLPARHMGAGRPHPGAEQASESAQRRPHL